MLKNDLFVRNPLRLLGGATEEILPDSGFGAVLARAGVGKTSFIVQLAMNSMLQGRKVLHISLGDPVEKVTLWYAEVFRNIAAEYQIPQPESLWEELLPHRFIMTFRVDRFTVPKLEERLSDLTEQAIFKPDVMIVDDLPFEGQVAGNLEAIKPLAQNFGFRAWFTVRTHRHESPNPDGVPIQLAPVAHLFDAAVQLQPEGDEIQVHLIKGGKPGDKVPSLRLEPATMLVKS